VLEWWLKDTAKAGSGTCATRPSATVRSFDPGLTPAIRGCIASQILTASGQGQHVDTNRSRFPSRAAAADVANAERPCIEQALHVVAVLGIADRLTDGPRSVRELASDTGAHEPSLYRVSRMLAGIGVFSEEMGATPSPNSIIEGVVA
jgi:hypothetical protein